MKNSINHFRRIIEQTDWDERMLKNERWLSRGCWAVVGIAAVYFGLICANTLAR